MEFSYWMEYVIMAVFPFMSMYGTLIFWSTNTLPCHWSNTGSTDIVSVCASL